MIAHYEPIMGVRVAEWGIRKMRTKWGTCNIQARRIWLNLELIKYPRHAGQHFERFAGLARRQATPRGLQLVDGQPHPELPDVIFGYNHFDAGGYFALVYGGFEVCDTKHQF